MTKSQLIEHVRNQTRLARIARDKGNEKAHEDVLRFTQILNQLPKLSLRDATILLVQNNLLVQDRGPADRVKSLSSTHVSDLAATGD